MVERIARRRLRRRAEAADHARHLRALAGYYEAYYGQAQKVRTVIAREHAAAFERFDLLVSPTSPTVAFRLGEKAADPLAMYLRPPHDPVLHGRAARAERPVRPLGRAPGRAAADRAAALRRTRSSAPGTRSSARSASTPSRAAAVSAHEWEPVVGLEIHVQLKTRTKAFAAARTGSAAARTRRSVRSASASRARCRCRTGPRSSGRSSSGSRSAARSPRARSSRARTTSTPTCRRDIRSLNTICPCINGRR